MGKSDKTRVVQDWNLSERLKALPIRTYRMVQNVTMTRSEISYATWSNLLHGKSMYFPAIKALANVLGISIEQLTDKTYPIKAPANVGEQMEQLKNKLGFVKLDG